MLPPGFNRTQDPDAPIKSTDNDAALARLSAVQKGYLQDPFVKNFIPRAHLQPSRPPLINIGTYVRSKGIDLLVDEWLQFAKQSGQKAQIVSLGAGSDTRFWRIEACPRNDDLERYIEVDFPEITTKKAMAIRKNKEMSALLGDPEQVQVVGGTGLRSSKYHLIPADLRLPPADSLGPALTGTESTEGNAILLPMLPTLIIFECVLAYMVPEASSRLLEWFVEYISTTPEGSGGVLGCVVYEMFNLQDSFGRVMVSNLKLRNVTLPGAEPFTTLESLSKRFTNIGFSAACALTLREIRRAYVEQSELERISKLEFLDETEELDLVLEHYAISWGLYLSNLALGKTWSQWGLKQERA